MRDSWQRSEAELALDAAAVSGMVAAALPAATVRSFRRVGGGLANTSLEVVLTGPPGRVLLRLFQRDPDGARKEAALAALVLGRGVPAARFLHVADGSATGHPWAMLEWIDGERLDQVVPTLGGSALGVLGRSVGAVLARIHGIGFPQQGWLDPALRVLPGSENGRAGLLAFLRRRLRDGPGGAWLGEALTAELFAFVERHGDRLDAWAGRPCLAHGDFNGSNLLVRQEPQGDPPGDPGEAWRVAAVLDWEYAFAGTPAFDFGNLLRPKPGEDGRFHDAVADGYAGAGGVLPPGWRGIARIADLYAWADVLGWPATGPALIEDARRTIRETIAAPA